MRNTSSVAGVSLVEVMISVAATSIILGALMISSMSIQKTIHASEVYGDSYSDQRRIIDYLGRDLRRSVAVAETDASGADASVGATGVTIADRSTLVLSLPGYYVSDAPADAKYDSALPVVSDEQRVDYGTSAGFAPLVAISYRKVFLAQEGCVCFIREEAGVPEVIVRHAENLTVCFLVATDGRSGVVKASFNAPYSNSGVQVATSETLMIRNPPANPDS